MQVILTKKVPGLGNTDDIKEVSAGYARNFLFAHQLAVLATGTALQAAQSRLRRQVSSSQSGLQREQSLAGQLADQEVQFTEKAGPGGQLYAAIGPQKISDYLTGKGFAVKKNQIIVPPIKSAGVYQASIKFSHGLEVKLKICVNAL